MEAQTAFIRTDCRVKLYTETTVDLNFAVVINPGYSELNKSFRLNKSFDKTGLLILWFLFNNGFKAFKNFFNSLKEFTFTGISFLYLFINFRKYEFLIICITCRLFIYTAILPYMKFYSIIHSQF